MKLLKKKILQAKEMLYLNGRKNHRNCLDPEEMDESFTEPVLDPKDPFIIRQKKGYYNPNLSRNVAVNFFKAICNFMISGPSLPYLQPALLKENIQFDEFYDFVNQVKIERTRQLGGFISTLKPHMNDSDKILACKRIMKSMTIVFVKYFSLGWIFQEQGFRMPFLKMRSKLMKRIRNLNDPYLSK